jgi:hypothetical protein
MRSWEEIGLLYTTALPRLSTLLLLVAVVVAPVGRVMVVAVPGAIEQPQDYQLQVVIHIL